MAIEITNISNFNINISDSIVGTPDELDIEIEATHGGYVNANGHFYTKDMFSKSYKSWTHPRRKPVIKNHDKKNVDAAIGRVYDSDVVHDSNGEYDSYIKLRAKITDSDAIEKILDGRYGSVSVSASTNNPPVCSICGNSPLDDDCDHRKNEIYDGDKCYWIFEDAVEYTELSFINVPADKYQKIVPLSEGQTISDNLKTEDDTIIEIFDAETENFNIKLNESEGGNTKINKITDKEAFKRYYLDVINPLIIELAENMEGIEDEMLDADKKDKPGGSNAGEYETEGPYCGPSGGAPEGSYPVNTKKRAIAALSYRRHAPNPSGIKKCVCRHWKSLPACNGEEDSMNEKDKKKILEEYVDREVYEDKKNELQKMKKDLIDVEKEYETLKSTHEKLKDEYESIIEENQEFRKQLHEKKAEELVELQLIANFISDDEKEDLIEEYSDRSLESLKDQISDLKKFLSNEKEREQIDSDSKDTYKDEKQNGSRGESESESEKKEVDINEL